MEFQKNPNLWVSYPALYHGFCALLGVAFSLTFSTLLFIPLLFLFFTSSSIKHILLGSLICILSFTHTHVRYHFPTLPDERVSGEGVFHIDTISIQSSPFQRSYACVGSLDFKEWKNIPCRLYLPLNKPRPLANQKWRVQGTLIQKERLVYTFKPTRCVPDGGFSLAELRFKAKESCASHLKSGPFNPTVSSFLLSMLTADIEDRTLNLEFNRLGLQHILGVSGFQFVLLTGCLGWILRRFFSSRTSTVLLLFLLTCYFIFLGSSPPVFRAWIGISLVLVGKLLNRRSSALNGLGVALLCELIDSPFTVTNIGFQLSFLCTFAILTWYPLVNQQLDFLIRKRSFKEVLKLSTLDQHGYLLGSWIRQALALNLAVHLVSLGLILFLFGKLPLVSLIYNLFFPLGAAISFLLLLAGLGLSMFVPPLGSWVHQLNNGLTQGLLAFTTHPPASWQFYIRSPDFSFNALLGCLTFLSFFPLLYPALYTNEFKIWDFGKAGAADLEQ